MNKIIWEPWACPFDGILEEYRRENPLEEDEDDPEWQNAQSRLGKLKHSGPVAVLPMGVFPIRESTLPSRLFELWRGDTNFHITHRVCDLISNTPGVESLDVFTPYRFRIGVGKAFNQVEVRWNIDRLFDPRTTPMEAVTSLLKKQSPYWAVLKYPLGRYEVVGGDSREEVEGKISSQPPYEERMVSWH